MLRLILVILVLLTLLSGCYNNAENNKIEKVEKVEFQYKAQHFTLGSINYKNEIMKIDKTKGTKEALDKVMYDVDKYDTEIDSNDELNNKKLYMLVSSLINKLGYVDVKIHYFRNKLNRSPKSLKEMIQVNSILPESRQWRLISLKGSLYHCQGNEGLYNLKFVSYDGFCEAVYNKNGVLLTEENDPINMGTFNYGAGIHSFNSHGKYDVKPYLKWGNADNSPQKGRHNIKEGVNTTLKIYKENPLVIDEYRGGIINAINEKAADMYTLK